MAVKIPEDALLWNRQWAITPFGIERIDGHRYEIEVSRFDERRPGEDKLGDWPLHLAEKGDVDIDGFLQVFRAAIAIHKITIGFDWAATEAEARQIAEQTAAS